MNEAQRKVLKNHRGEILENLIVDDILLSCLLEKDILTDHMYQLIKGKATDHEKVGELLYILPKRGPDAFKRFIEAIRKSSVWLADTLESSCVEWENILLKTDYYSATEETNIQPAEAEQEASETTQEKETVTTEEKDDIINTPTNIVVPSEEPEKIVQNEIPRETSKPVPKPRQSLHSASMHTGLNNLYTKLKTRLYCKNIREHSFSSPEPATCEMISQLIDELFQNLDDIERTINQCYALIGGRDKRYPLVSRIIDLQNAKSALQSDMKMKEQQKNKYGDHISKLENRCRNQTTEIHQLKEDIQHLKDEGAVISAERDEKQTMIDDLRKLINESTKNQKGRANHMSMVSLSGLAENKQLKDEMKKLRVENQSLKKTNADNLVYLKSESLKKLSKMREKDEDQTKYDNVSQGHSKCRSRQVYVDKSATIQIPGSNEQSIQDYMDKNLDKQYQIQKAIEKQPVPNGVLKERTRQSLEDINSFDEIVIRERRSDDNRKERKRVTFSTGYSSEDDSKVAIDSEKQEQEANFRAALNTVTNGNATAITDRFQGGRHPGKGVRGRLRKSENKQHGKRSSSTSSVPSNRDATRAPSYMASRSRGYSRNASQW